MLNKRLNYFIHKKYNHEDGVQQIFDFAIALFNNSIERKTVSFSKSFKCEKTSFK